MMTKFVLAMILIGVFSFTNEGTPELELTPERVKTDLKKCKDCFKNTNFTMEDIMQNFPTGDALEYQLFNSGAYYFLHVSIPDEFSGCTFSDSPVFLYKKIDNKLKFVNLLLGGYEFQPLQKGLNYFVSDIKCTSANFEQTTSYSIKEFINESFNEIVSLSGYDKSMYYLTLYQRGYANKQGIEGYEDYDDDLSIFNSSIGDTIKNVSKCTNLKIEGGKLKKFTIEEEIEVLKGISSDQESIKSENYTKRTDVVVGN